MEYSKIKQRPQIQTKWIHCVSTKSFLFWKILITIQ